MVDALGRGLSKHLHPNIHQFPPLPATTGARALNQVQEISHDFLSTGRNLLDDCEEGVAYVGSAGSIQIFVEYPVELDIFIETNLFHVISDHVRTNTVINRSMDAKLEAGYVENDVGLREVEGSEFTSSRRFRTAILGNIQFVRTSNCRRVYQEY